MKEKKVRAGNVTVVFIKIGGRSKEKRLGRGGRLNSGKEIGGKGGKRAEEDCENDKEFGRGLKRKQDDKGAEKFQSV